ncbi:MAG: hypothetical protein PQJ50_16405 [Spirochaetales bacterium]|nr:hypothetical protein [Spirochaetales bacterium]
MITWTILRSFHIGLWVFGLYRGFSIMIFEGWDFLTVLVIINLIQFFSFSLSIGKKRGYSPGQSLIMTLLLGFSWWYPLQHDTGG